MMEDMKPATGPDVVKDSTQIDQGPRRSEILRDDKIWETFWANVEKGSGGKA